MNEGRPVLFGSYQRPVDSKGRLVIPNPLRQGAGSEELILLKWFDNSLALFPEPRWLELARAVNRFPSFTQQDRRMRRAFFGSAVPLKPDNQGRVVLPEEMRTYAFLEDKAVLIGDFDKVEVWSAHHYQKEERNSDAQVNDTFERVLGRVYAPGTTGEPPPAAPFEMKESR